MVVGSPPDLPRGNSALGHSASWRHKEATAAGLTSAGGGPSITTGQMLSKIQVSDGCLLEMRLLQSVRRAFTTRGIGADHGRFGMATGIEAEDRYDPTTSRS